MRDVHKFDEDWVTVKQIFEESSNVGVSKIIYDNYKDQPEKFIGHLRRIGLDKRLGIELPGEGKPFIKDPSDKRHWYGTTLPWMSVGYELMITPLQLLTLYNAIANDGKMVKPLFVREIQDGGRTISRFDTTILNDNICSFKTLKTIQSLLQGVVENGTAKSINDTLFKIAGKTGTALIANNNKGYSQREYNASFAGYFPADKPKYSCIVVINRPTGDYYYGGSVAAPVFKDIAKQVYAYQLDIHEYPEEKKETKAVLLTSAKGYYYDLKTTFSGLRYPTGNIQPGSDWSVVYSNENRLQFEPLVFAPDTIADLTGLCLKDALFITEQQGLVPIIRGKGHVSGQSIQAGSPVTRGQEIILQLKNGKS
jgi:cell division protein FtsI (penicillin-binding protein 3)